MGKSWPVPRLDTSFGKVLQYHEDNCGTFKECKVKFKRLSSPIMNIFQTPGYRSLWISFTKLLGLD